METDPVLLLSGLKAYLILNIIPLIINALWLENLKSEFHNAIIKDTQMDQQLFRERIRFASLLVILSVFLLYLGSEELRNAFQLYCSAILFGTITLQISYQFYTERTLITQIQPSENAFVIFVKGIRAWAMASLICAFLAIFSVEAAALVLSWLQPPKIIAALVLLGSGLSGLGAGIFVNYLLCPYYLMKIFPKSPLEDEKISQIIHTLFSRQSVPLPKIWILELKQIRIIDTLITGVRAGKKFYNYFLLISRLTLNKLSVGEIEALLQVQLSHSLLKHNQKRFLLIMSLILNGVLISLLAALTLQMLFPKEASIAFFGTLLGAGVFLGSFRWIAIQGEAQEFEADTFALDFMNLNFENFSTALRKLDGKSDDADVLQDRFLETEKRIALLEAYARKKQSQEPSASTQLAG